MCGSSELIHAGDNSGVRKHAEYHDQGHNQPVSLEWSVDFARSKHGNSETGWQAQPSALRHLQHGNDSPRNCGQRFRSLSVSEVLCGNADTWAAPGCAGGCAAAPESPDETDDSGRGAGMLGDDAGGESPPGGSDGGAGRRSRSTLSREQAVEIYELKLSHGVGASTPRWWRSGTA